MNYPSVKTLSKLPNITHETATKIRRILVCTSNKAVTELSDTAAAQRIRECHNSPSITNVKLTAIDALIGTYGVEYIPRGHNRNSPSISYCNAGDPYICTVLYDGRYKVGCWGDIVERGDYD